MDNWYECLVCTEPCADAVETDCTCHLLLCARCAKDIRECPTCRQEAVTFTASHAVRRIISSMPTPCPHCNTQSTFGDLKTHLKYCEARPIRCSKCEFTGLRHALVGHANDEHPDDIVAFFSKQLEAPNRNCIEPRQNQAGNMARLGDTGKFYCGKRLNGQCGCCNGNCGPNNGCNCVDCMRLDVEVRQLPPSTLVNRQGRVSQRLGRGFVCGIRDCTGPSNRCTGCRRLEEQASSRYSALL